MRRLLPFLLIVQLTACSHLDNLKNKLLRIPPGVQYTERMEAVAGKGDAEAMTWLLEAEEALNDSVQLLTPFRETGALQSERITAIGYRLKLREGERLTLKLETDLDSLNIFVDLFQLQMTTADTTYDRLRSLDRLTPTAEYEVLESGWYQIRLQSELYAVGLYELIVVKAPVLGFPVAGKGNDAIWTRLRKSGRTGGQ